MRTHGIGRRVKGRRAGPFMAGFTGLVTVVAATVIAFPVLAQQEYAATRPAGAEGSMSVTSTELRPISAAAGAVPVYVATRLSGMVDYETLYLASGCKMPFLEVNYVDVGDASYQTATAQATSNWNNVTLIRFGVRLTKRTHIVVYQFNDPNDKNVAVTEYYPGDCTGGKSVLIRYNRYWMDSYSFDKRVAIAVHEFGHALGLADLYFTLSPNICPVAIMYGYDNQWDVCMKNTPQRGDINGIRAIYGY